MENGKNGTDVPSVDRAVDLPTKPPLSEEDLALLKKHRHTFIGTYGHSLDSKGRMVVPLAFRELLGERFYITPTFDFKAIALYPELEYARMRDYYDQLLKVHRTPELQTYLQHFDAFSYRDQECDGQGRVLLPTRIRQVLLGDEKDVDVSGNGDHVCIGPRPAEETNLQAFLGGMDNTLNVIGGLRL